MGYSAFVLCNCYKEGKINSKPPHEEFIILDEEGLELNLPWEGNQDKYSAFWRWLQGNVCSHVNMQYCKEDLANSSGMGGFRNICHKLGETQFPILNQYLPTANGGYLPARYASQLLEELYKMSHLDSNERMIVLKEKNRDEVVYSTNIGYDREFYFGGNTPFNCGIGDAGFYVVKKYNFFNFRFKRKIWISKSFTQEKDKSGKFFFKDKISGKKLSINFNLLILEKEKNEYFEFEVIEKQSTVIEEYSYIIEPLIKLANASIETGNNICWT